MIGWRPYLLTALGVALIVLAGLDVGTTLRNSSTCASANAVRSGGLLAQARQQYQTVLMVHPRARCATAGLSKTTDAQCAEAEAVAAVDPTQARSELLALATGEPSPRADSCVWRELHALPASGPG
jgi:hypothetical protein